MNIAFPALLVFALVLPGFICRSAYFDTEKTDLSNQPFSVEGTVSFVLSIALHLVWIQLSSAFSPILGFPVYVNVDDVFTLLSHTSENATQAALLNISNNIYPISTYFISLYIASWCLGTVAQMSVKHFELDIKFPTLFKFDIPWFYQFKRVVLVSKDEHGDTVKTVITKDKYPKFFVMITCAVTRPDDTYLYSGALDDFFFKKDGTLDRIVLTAVYRRKISSDDEEKNAIDRASPPFYAIEGHRVIIRYEDISSLSIEYILDYPDPPDTDKAS